MRKGEWILTLGLLIGLLFASPAAVIAQTPDPAAGNAAEVTPEGTGDVPVVGATPEATEEGGEPAASGLLEGIVQTRTPVPSATPGLIVSGVEELAAEIGLARTEFLGLRAPDWINLGLSLLFVLAAYLLGTWLALKPLPYLVRRTPTQFDDAFLKQAGPGLRWLVVLYAYPDPRYRIETHVGIAYGTHIETARRVIIEAVQQVEGVLPNKPVDALYNEMGDSEMIFRVRWWIESYVDTRRVIDRVHTALQHALDEAGIESPFPTQNVNLQVLAQEFEERSRPASRVDDRLDMTPEPGQQPESRMKEVRI